MMSLARWVVYGLLVLLTVLAAGWLYLRREPAGPGRLVLAGLRAAALSLVLLLLFDPLLPAAVAGSRSRSPHLLLDVSASMSLPRSVTDTTSRWTAAVREAERRRGDVLLFGDRVRPSSPDSLRRLEPGDGRSQLLPALRAAAEAGATRVVVITDGELEASASIPGWLARLGLGVEWVSVGGPLGGLALPEVSAPAWAESDSPLELRATVAARGGASPDSATLVVSQGGQVLARRPIARPAPGRSVEVPLSVRPAAPPEGGYVRLEVALEPGDVLAADDRRTVTSFVSAEPAGVTLVSLAPDQEPRFLLPVLGRALGLPVLGFLRTATGWLRMGGSQEAGVRAAEPEVRRAVERAELLVVQGLAGSPPDWLAGALATKGAILLLTPGDVRGLPVAPGLPVAGDWFLSGRVPPSPVAAQVTGASTAELPPLSALQTASAPAGAWAPLLVTRGRGGEPRPMLLAGESAGRRWAVALGQGYWQWAFQGGDGRALYEQLWSAVGGWLLGGAAPGAAEVRPIARVVARGERTRWVTPGERPDSLRLTLLTPAGAPAVDTVLRAAASDTLEAPVVPPGSYRYRALAFTGDARLAGSGEVTVETWSPELARPAAVLGELQPVGRLAEPGGQRGLRRPLHALPAPYVLLVLLLAAEWILRRRWGLR